MHIGRSQLVVSPSRGKTQSSLPAVGLPHRSLHTPGARDSKKAIQATGGPRVSPFPCPSAFLPLKKFLQNLHLMRFKRSLPLPSPARSLEQSRPGHPQRRQAEVLRSDRPPCGPLRPRERPRRSRAQADSRRAALSRPPFPGSIWRRSDTEKARPSIRRGHFEGAKTKTLSPLPVPGWAATLVALRAPRCCAAPTRRGSLPSARSGAPPSARAALSRGCRGRGGDRRCPRSPTRPRPRIDCGAGPAAPAPRPGLRAPASRPRVARGPLRPSSPGSVSNSSF